MLNNIHFLGFQTVQLAMVVDGTKCMHALIEKGLLLVFMMHVPVPLRDINSFVLLFLSSFSSMSSFWVNCEASFK